MIFKIGNYLKKQTRNNRLKKIVGYKEIEGWLTENEALALNEIAQLLPKKSTSLEIGSWKGKSSYCIAKGVKNGKLIVIDPFNASGGQDIESEKEYMKRQEQTQLLDIFIYNMKKFNVLNKIIIKKGYSYELHEDIQSLDFLFIDGDHSIEGCKKDFDLYAKKVKRGGYIAFHDYDSSRPKLGPTYVVENYVKKSSEFSFYGVFDSLWIGYKND